MSTFSDMGGVGVRRGADGADTASARPTESAFATLPCDVMIDDRRMACLSTMQMFDLLAPCKCLLSCHGHWMLTFRDLPFLLAHSYPYHTHEADLRSPTPP